MVTKHIPYVPRDGYRVLFGPLGPHFPACATGAWVQLVGNGPPVFVIEKMLPQYTVN